MAYYKLKANLDGFEIEFNTKERHLIEAQMNDYLAIFTGNKPLPRQYEPQKRQVESVNYEQKFMEQRAQAITPKVENQQYVPQSENVYRAQAQVQQQTQYIQQQTQYAQYQAQTQQYSQEEVKPQVNEEKIREKISFNFETKEEQSQKSFNEIYSEQQTVNNAQTGDFRYAQNINQNNFAYDNVQNQAIQNYNSEPAQNPYQNQGLDLYQPKREPDLPEFMHNKLSNGIFDDFIITAYFIKNVLNIKNFSIKFLNSKLYAAKEKLVDYAILNEAISRNYVKYIEGSQETGTKEYAITEAGESYYLSLDNG